MSKVRQEDLARLIELVGGRENIATVSHCITRLRLTLKDRRLVNESALKSLGAAGVIKIGESNLQVVLGPLAEIVADEMRKVPAGEDLSQVKLPG